MRGQPIYAAACPCCTSSLVVLVNIFPGSVLYDRTLGPFVWACAYCGFVLMGLAVPTSPTLYMDRSRNYRCLEVVDMTAAGFGA